MNPGSYHRKISAIWSADVAGYSRLMGDDEEKTVQTLTRYRRIMSDLIGQHRGRVVDSPGDNLLAEFSSVVEALRCAWDVQQELAKRNAELSEGRRMHFRIGLNLGDVIEEKGQLYGDGVNVAARLESLAAPGGILLSGTVYDQVKHKLPIQLEFVGEQTVKNIEDPVRTYRVVMGPGERTGPSSSRTGTRKRSKAGLLLLLAAALALLGSGFYYWVVMHARVLADRPAASSSQDQPMAQKTSIAVLPFKNLSGDSEQEYFSDGITNDIITDLSRFHNLLVIASNTVFLYKDTTVNIKDVGQELGVRYILEGSVQKAGDSVRINAQLIDVSTGTHVWAERYRREYRDIFKLQGAIVQAIVTNLAIKTFQSEQARAMRKKPQDLQAYDYLLRGYAHYHQRTRAAYATAREMFARAAELDPYYAAAYVGLGLLEYGKVAYGWTEFPDKALANAFALGQKALKLGESNAAAHALLSSVYTFQNQYDLAIQEAQRAIELNPNDSGSYNELGWALLWSGRLDGAIAALEMSLRLDSASPRNTWWHLGVAYYLKERYEEALNILAQGQIKRPNFVGYQIALAATYARLGRTAEAARAAAALRRLDPFFEVDSFGTGFRQPAHREAIVAGLRAAGLK
jgi:adenylate cyclase